VTAPTRSGGPSPSPNATVGVGQLAQEPGVGEAVDALGAALQAVAISLSGSRPGAQLDAVVDVKVDDRTLVVALEHKAYCTGQTARQLITMTDHKTLEGLPMVVADRMTAEARDLLSDAGWSWLDRRGRLHLRWPTVRVDLEVAPSVPHNAANMERAISGRSGVTVAYWLLRHPDRSLSPTGQRSELTLAPSSISTAVRRLSEASLVDEHGHAMVPELFWELANAWRTERAWLTRTPAPADYSRPRGTAWRRSGSAAAAAWGAPVVTTGSGPVELYVGGPVELSIARRRYGAADPGTGTAVLSVPPTNLVLVDTVVADEIPMVDGWSVAPRLAVALDLAQDRGRGREILAAWNERDAIWR
jgi:hypothetical protein